MESQDFNSGTVLDDCYHGTSKENAENISNYSGSHAHFTA